MGELELMHRLTKIAMIMRQLDDALVDLSGTCDIDLSTHQTGEVDTIHSGTKDLIVHTFNLYHHHLEPSAGYLHEHMVECIDEVYRRCRESSRWMHDDDNKNPVDAMKKLPTSLHFYLR